MIMPELKSLARERRLRGYSLMRKTELVALLQNSPPPGLSPASTSPTPPTQTWEPIDGRRPRKPSPQEMDIFEQQEISKSRPQVKTKLNKWYDWLINHVPKPIKDGASKLFKTFSKPSPQEMDIFEQQEISKSRPQVKTKLNKWYDWLINHVPKPIKDGASKVFKTLSKPSPQEMDIFEQQEISKS